MVSAVVTKNNLEILLASAYLPATLDNLGMPSKWDASDRRQSAVVQGEAHGLYATLLEWTKRHPKWLLGGDLNETRHNIDRSTLRENKNRKPKFINNFLEE